MTLWKLQLAAELPCICSHIFFVLQQSDEETVPKITNSLLL